MHKICANPRCQHHQPCPKGLENEARIAIVQLRGGGTFVPGNVVPRCQDDNRVIVDRVMFSRGGVPQFYMCACCAYAVQMVTG